MTKFVLTCINEDLEIVDQKLYDSYDEAREEMHVQYTRELNAMSGVEEILHEHGIFATSATIVYGIQPYQYEWKIKEV